MFNLSFHGSHNATIAISKEDEVLECVEFERLLSKKNAALFYYENPKDRVEYIKFVEKYFREKYGVEKYDNIIYNSVDEKKFDFKSVFSYDNLHYMMHHEAHANSVFYQSPYEEALIISFDGGSDEGFFNIFYGKKFEDLKKILIDLLKYFLNMEFLIGIVLFLLRMEKILQQQINMYLSNYFTKKLNHF